MKTLRTPIVRLFGPFAHVLRRATVRHAVGELLFGGLAKYLWCSLLE
jgi:hypothetical protein